jgi:hypothetical protein
MPATNYPSFILIVLITQIIFSEHILWSSSLCSLLHDLAVGSLLHSNILLSILLSIYVLLSGKNFKYVNNLPLFKAKTYCALPASCLGFKYLAFFLQKKIFFVCKILVSVSVMTKWWEYDYWSMINIISSSTLKKWLNKLSYNNLC